MKKLLFILIVVLFSSCSKDDCKYNEMILSRCHETITNTKTSEIIKEAKYKNNYVFVIQENKYIVNDISSMPTPIKGFKNTYVMHYSVAVNEISISIVDKYTTTHYLFTNRKPRNK